ncbi:MULTISPECIES: hypothetical protein [unclassified Exiguobacterium]|uniref:hypothetical protein n=1 Tax=unclassified Exiguobacterium TaxID=2644629 RepID=UPI001BEB040A|nr:MULTISPECIES: hypothetical protein [unclassified Exiguobacterium]
MQELTIIERKHLHKQIEDNLDNYFILDEIKKVYEIASYDDLTINDNQEILIDFLIYQNVYPIVITFILSKDISQDNEIVKKMDSRKINYSMNDYSEDENSFYYCNAIIENEKDVRFLINETYLIPAQNGFYNIIFKDELNFTFKKYGKWLFSRTQFVPLIDMSIPTSFIKVDGDGLGFILFSNEKKYETIEELTKYIPHKFDIDYLNENEL